MKSGPSALVEKSRIAKAMRDSTLRGFKIQGPMECVRDAIVQFGSSVCVACSFGSCSVVVLHMALQIDPDVLVVFNNTGVEYPETLRYKEMLVKDWKLNLVETKPIKSFWQCVEEYGFPLLRGKRSRKYGNPGKPPCCRFLKEIPMREAAKKHGIRAVITGLRAAESRARMFAFAQLGQNYASHKFFDIVKFNPIAFWTHDELWKYIREQGLPVNPIYRKVARSGCMPCTGYTNWEAQLAKVNPRMYRYVQKLRGVALFEDFLSLEEAQVVSPCASTEPAKLTEWF